MKNKRIIMAKRPVGEPDYNDRDIGKAETPFHILRKLGLLRGRNFGKQLVKIKDGQDDA